MYKSMLRRELGIDVVSISEPIGDDKMSILFEAMIEAMDEYYSINLAEEVRRGMTQRAKEGGFNTYAPFGYRLENKQYIPDPDTAPIVRKIFADFLNGLSINAMVHQINDLGIRTRFGNRFDRRNVEYILKNPVYIGKVRWTPTGRVNRHESKDTIVTDGTHEPLITLETFQAAQAKLEQQRRAYGRYHREDGKPFMLKGIVKCSSCGGTLVSAPASKGLQCHNYARGQCPQSHYISLPFITAAVINQITDDFTSMNFSVLSTDGTRIRNDADTSIIDRQIERERMKLRRIRDAYETDDFTSMNFSVLSTDGTRIRNDADTSIIDRQIERERMKLRRIRDAYESGIDTLEEYRENKRRITEQIERLESSRPQPQEVISTAEFVRRHMADLEKLKRDDVPDEEKNKVLSSFVQKIIFDRENTAFTILYRAI